MNVHKKLALLIVAACIALDAILGLLFAWAQHIPWYTGLYFATTTATTVGYGDVTPRGWAAHAIAVLMMLTIIPLVSVTWALVTTWLTTEHITRHIDKRHNEMKKHVTDAGL